MQKTQLTLGLHLKDEATFDNFYCGKNTEIVNILKKAIHGESEKIIFLHGNRGQGCSHLLQACCHEAYQHQISSVYLPFNYLLESTHAELLQGLESLNVVCFDDLHVIAGRADWEEAVFHLYNRIYDQGGTIIMAAQDSPKVLSFQLPDLISRLSWGMVYKLYPLTDDEKLAALMMRAHRRGIGLSEEVGRYLLRHCPRHMATLFAAFDTLDKASLAAQRRLTIPFIKEVLEI